MKKEIKERLKDLELRTGIKENGVKVVSPDEYQKLERDGKVNKDLYYIIDNIGFPDEETLNKTSC